MSIQEFCNKYATNNEEKCILAYAIYQLIFDFFFDAHVPEGDDVPDEFFTALDGEVREIRGSSPTVWGLLEHVNGGEADYGLYPEYNDLSDVDWEYLSSFTESDDEEFKLEVITFCNDWVKTFVEGGKSDVYSE